MPPIVTYGRGVVQIRNDLSIKDHFHLRSSRMRRMRELRDGARYHVTARANRKEMILEKDSMKELFISIVKRAKTKYDFRIENFCIMGNHIHFIIYPLHGESLSAIMRWILSVFAMSFNKILGLTGHVWGGRFFSKILSSLRDLVQAFEYIDENPVKAQLVGDKREWRYGGIGHERAGCRDIVDEAPSWLGQLLPDHGKTLLD